MLSVEMKINGSLIVHIYAHNHICVETRPETYLYKYEVYEVNTDKELARGSVIHLYDDGLVKLVSLILEDYLKKE